MVNIASSTARSTLLKPVAEVIDFAAIRLVIAMLWNKLCPKKGCCGKTRERLHFASEESILAIFKATSRLSGIDKDSTVGLTHSSLMAKDFG